MTEMDESGESWSEMDIADLAHSLAIAERSRTQQVSFAGTEEEVRQKAKDLGLVEHPGKRGSMRLVR